MGRAARLVLVLVAVSARLVAQTTTGAAGIGPEVSSSCFTNLQGLGICQPAQLCPLSAECDAATPCLDGKVCTIGTACLSTRAGVCLVSFADGGCSNPGTTATGFHPCAPVVFHEDFDQAAAGATEGAPLPGLDKLETVPYCGAGGSLFKESSCGANLLASSPLEAARWGVSLGACFGYAAGSHRVQATTAEIDISACAGAQLDFDYSLDLEESGVYDRVFVTVSVDYERQRLLATNQIPGAQAFTSSVNSCGGTVLPVGNLVQDGQWHHFRAAIGSGTQVIARFWAETSDGLSNTGAGWFFDDVRIDCSALLFAEGFEGGNFLRWSFTTAPPLLVEVVQAGFCKEYLSCAGPGSSCGNYKTSDGPTYCLSPPPEGAATCYGGVSECAANEVCVVGSCAFEPVCAPARCDP